MSKRKRQLELFAVGLKHDRLITVTNCIQKINPTVCCMPFTYPEEALTALRHRSYTQQPGLILLDDSLINQFLWKAKGHPLMRQVPVLVIASQVSEQVLKQAYQQGANSVIEVPQSTQAFMEVMNTTLSYWFNYAALTDGDFLGQSR